MIVRGEQADLGIPERSDGITPAGSFQDLRRIFSGLRKTFSGHFHNPRITFLYARVLNVMRTT